MRSAAAWASGDKFGLTPFGKLAVKEMEKEGIVIDVSHASKHSL